MVYRVERVYVQTCSVHETVYTYMYVYSICMIILRASVAMINCCSVEFYDELSKVESSVDAGYREGEGERETDDPPQMTDFSVKALKLSGLTVELGNEAVQEVKLNQSLNGMPVMVLHTCSMYVVCPL